MFDTLANIFGVLIGLALCGLSFVGILQILQSKDEDTDL